MSQRSTRQLVFSALLLAIGVILGVFETYYLPPLPVPGAKLGLANIVTIFLVIYLPWRDALANVALRVVAIGLLTGTFLSTIFIFSLVAGIGAYIAMYFVYRFSGRLFTLVGVSVMGAVVHNVIQLLIAVWLLGTWGVAFHLPLLIITGVASGAFNGAIANMIQSRGDLQPILKAAFER